MCKYHGPITEKGQWTNTWPPIHSYKYTHCNASVVHFFVIWITDHLNEYLPLQARELITRESKQAWGITREWAQFNKGATGTYLYCLGTKGMQCLTMSAHTTTNEYNCILPATGLQ